MPEPETLNIAEIPYDSGEMEYRYARYLAEDGSRWIRHGLFCSYWRNGNLRSQGHYAHGYETGIWSDYHENGQMAAKGQYIEGQQQGTWRFWDAAGNEEQSAQYRDGEEVPND